MAAVAPPRAAERPLAPCHATPSVTPSARKPRAVGACSSRHSASRPKFCAPVGAISQGREAAPETDTQWVEVGLIRGPHGVYGEMKVMPLTDFPEDRLGTAGTRWLQAPTPKLGASSGEPVATELEYGRTTISKGQQMWLVKLGDVDSPEEAALLRGHVLLVPAAARPPLEDEDEFYATDLVGLRVELAGGKALGRVVDLHDGTGSHDLLRIELDREPGMAPEDPAKQVLLPFVKAMVPVIDLAAGRMEVVPPEGLLALAAPPKARLPRRENAGRRERRRERPRRPPTNAGGGGAGPPAAESG